MKKHNKRYGIDKERDLVNWLYYKGVTALRCCGSGGGTKKPRPDIIAYKDNNYYAIELKSSIQDNVYINDKQVKNLIKFSKAFKSIPIIAVKFNLVKYCFLSIYDLKITDKGNYKFSRSEAVNFKNKYFE